ncbi:MutS domain V containing protein [Colletotrichum tofieldiae]|nr:MutS domain V containing protein [Colletotrichum tofieldiae]
MAVDVKEKGGLGCAYYNSDEGKLFMLHDMSCAEPLQLIETIMVHVQPTTVLLPLKTPNAVLQFLEQQKSTVDGGDQVSSQVTA